MGPVPDLNNFTFNEAKSFIYVRYKSKEVGQKQYGDDGIYYTLHTIYART